MKIEVEMNEEMIIKLLTEDAKTQVWHIHNTLHELSKKKEIYHIQDMKHHFETLQAFNMLLQYYGGDCVHFEQTDWIPEVEESIPGTIDRKTEKEDEGSFSSGATVDELVRGTTKAQEHDKLIYGTDAGAYYRFESIYEKGNKEDVKAVEEDDDIILTSEELDVEALGRFINNDATVEDMARAWASMDGKEDRFDKGKADPEFDNTDGTYSGYCVEAREILERAANYAAKRED
jgi:hypothetical protein